LGEFNSAMHNFTEHVPQLLEALNIKTFKLGQELPPEQWSRQLPLAYEHSTITHRPVVVLMELD
jgi:sulfopyruvate decarboxylase subunit alpha